jgi:Tfp pilus assembly protein PilF
LSALVSAGSQDAEVYYRLGQLQLERGDQKAAVGNLELAAKKTPENEGFHQALLDAYRKNNQPKEAEREKELLDALKTQHARVASPGATAPAATASTEPD